MQSPVTANVLTCTQCGGELHPDEGQIFLTCPYCSSTVFVDKARVVFHWQLAPTLDEPKARAALARWMAGNQTVKDLDKKARLVGHTFEYFPLWHFKRRVGTAKEELLTQPAAAISVSEIHHLSILAGDLRKYDASLDPIAQPPTVPLETALEWIGGSSSPNGEVAEQALVHIPLYTYKYDYQGQTYTALVEAGTGKVFANIYPSKAEAPYLLAAGISAAVFLVLALAPVIGVFLGDETGALIGLGVCTGLGLLAAPVLFAMAAWVAAKV